MTLEVWAVIAGLVIAAAAAFAFLRKPMKARSLARRRLAARARWRSATSTQETKAATAAPVEKALPDDPSANGKHGGLRDLQDLEVSDVMVHRTNMRSVNVDQPAETIVREILGSPNTRIPLWRGSIDNIVGVVHAKPTRPG
jgi:Mg2+/Co2+ transporter CorB